jgi:hypothetical protein
MMAIYNKREEEEVKMNNKEMLEAVKLIQIPETDDRWMFGTTSFGLIHGDGKYIIVDCNHLDRGEALLVYDEETDLEYIEEHFLSFYMGFRYATYNAELLMEEVMSQVSSHDHSEESCDHTHTEECQHNHSESCNHTHA